MAVRVFDEFFKRLKRLILTMKSRLVYERDVETLSNSPFKHLVKVRADRTLEPKQIEIRIWNKLGMDFVSLSPKQARELAKSILEAVSFLED